MNTRPDMLTLVDFVQKHQGKTAEAENLVKTFVEGLPPAARYFPSEKNKHTAKAYLDKKASSPIAGAFGCAVQLALISVARISINSLPTIKDLYGTLPRDKDSNMKLYLYMRAALFQVAKVGDCSYRASYAALCLFEILKGVKLCIALKSAPTKDQFTVMLGSKSTGFFVYDPQTNPTMVYDLAFYQKNILSTYSDVEHPAAEMSLRITSELADDYANRFPKIEETFKRLLESPDLTPSRLCQDPSYLDNLRLNGIKSKEYPKYITEALAMLQTLVQTNEVSRQLRMQ